jgi:hypothetical protein
MEEKKSCCPECGTTEIACYDNQSLSNNEDKGLVDFSMGLDPEIYADAHCVNGHKFSVVGRIQWPKSYQHVDKWKQISEFLETKLHYAEDELKDELYELIYKKND